jgi:hypothetical protein
VNTEARSRNRITLPSFGTEVFTYLKDVNDRESFTASRRLKDLLSANLKSELEQHFDRSSLEKLSQALSRKITNSLLSPGSSGQSRTKDALIEVGALDNSLISRPNYESITEALRMWSQDFRSAKGALDNNFKCINSFLRVQNTTNDETVRKLLKYEINTHSDFIKWSEELKRYWKQKGLVKSNISLSYLNTFNAFIDTFDQNLFNTEFRILLDLLWLEYLKEEQKSNLNINLAERKALDSFKAMTPTNFFDIDLQIENGVISYRTIFHAMSEFYVSQLRFKLALDLATSDLFPNISFTVSTKVENEPVLLIRAEGATNEVDVANIVNFLESTIKNSKPV